MPLKREKREMTFRKESFPVMFHYYRCKESGQQFTTTELDQLNLTQLYNQYRSKHHIPFPDEIREIREKYNVSASRMAQILGFGINVYRQYEQGEVPNHSNARLIHLARDPEEFLELVRLSDLEDKPREKLINQVRKIAEKEQTLAEKEALIHWLTQSPLPDEYTGYRRPNLEKLTQVVRYFTELVRPWKTQLNKMLFYADFLHFKRTGFSITGFRYSAIDMGPVPDKFQSLFEYITEASALKIKTQYFPDGGIGERFELEEETSEQSNFSASEAATLQYVVDQFSQMNAKALIEKSHNEAAWQANADNKGQWISYQEYGFEINENS